MTPQITNKLPLGTVLRRNVATETLTANELYVVCYHLRDCAIVRNDLKQDRLVTNLELKLGHWELWTPVLKR